MFSYDQHLGQTYLTSRISRLESNLFILLSDSDYLSEYSDLLLILIGLKAIICTITHKHTHTHPTHYS